MYRIDENVHKEKYTLLIPATIDMHYPLIKYMFWSKDYRVEVLDNTEDVIGTGLKYANNEMCFPFILMVGQVINALRSCKYDLSRTRLLMPAAGDACRGACYIGSLRRALDKADLGECKVLTINVRHIEEDANLDITLDMGIRGLYGLFYSDILMLLVNQVRPYEINKGEAEKLWQKWTDKAADDLKAGKNLKRKVLFENFDRICADFEKIERTREPKKKVGIVGEFYAKYCGLGNWNVVNYIEKCGMETHTNGLSWYVLYYIDTHTPDKAGIEQSAFMFARRLVLDWQNKMIATLQRHGFYTLPNIDVLREGSKDYVSENLENGDGWLLGTEVIGHINHDCKRVLCIAPFGCMANVCAGRGLYPYLKRCFPESIISTVEPDASGSTGNYFNRVQILLSQ